MQGHEGDAGVGVVLVGVGGESGVVEEFGEGFAAGFGIVGGVGQFLQVFNAAEGFRRGFGFKGLDVAGAVDEEADQLGERGRVAGGSEGSSEAFCAGRLPGRFFGWDGIRCPGPRSAALVRAPVSAS